jgi:DNA-binding CsgD family transcriptional regulator
MAALSIALSLIVHSCSRLFAVGQLGVEVARRFGAVSSLGAALRIQARLTEDEHLAREAVSLLEHSPRRLEHARALVDLGALLRRRGDRRESRAPLRKGHEVATACGARDLAARAQDELAASGAHISRRDPTRRDLLTPSEHRIATLAADGDTNREIAQSLFLTVKTVEMHLSNAYRKLGVRSRHDLPEALAANSRSEWFLTGGAAAARHR